jgi:putative SOS response-associated peptidase YedK
MCGRYVITSAPEAIRALFRYWEQPDFPPRYNVAPTQPVPIVRLASGVRSFALVRWGFVPAWVKDPRNFTLLVNARGESVGERAAFKNAMARRRCLFPADGFYEWKAGGEKSRPLLRPTAAQRADCLCGIVGGLDGAERRGGRDRLHCHHRGEPDIGADP